MTCRRLGNMLMALVVLVSVSCKHDEMEYGVDFSRLPNHGLSFVPFHEQDYDLNEMPGPSSPDGRRKASSIDAVGILRGMTETLTASSVHQVSGTYQSTDAYGKPMTLSGAVYYPKDQVLKGIIVSNHYTVCADYEVPSNTCYMDAWLAAKGYALIMPDYMGYGATVDSVPPYMQADLTARHVIDMTLAVRSFFAERGLNIQSPDIIIMGYSQGAHASIHTMRILEDPENYPEYKDAQLYIKKCYVGGGPYYVSAFYQLCVESNFISIPCSVPMLLVGMNVGRAGNDIFDPALFFSERMNANYEEWVLSKRYTVDQINDLIGTRKLNEILSKEACDFENVAARCFNNNLLKHDVPEDFVPKAPLYVFHSKDDDVVALYHAERLQSQLMELNAANVTFDIDHYGVHGVAYVQFLMKILSILP